MREAPLLDFDFGGASGRRRFQTEEDVASFVELHLSSYQWLNSVGSGESQHLTNEYFNALVHTRSVLQQNSGNPQLDQLLARQFDGIFISGNLPLHASSDFDFVEEIRKARGGRTAAAALSYITNKFSQVHLSSRETFDGLLLAFARQEGISKASAASAKGTYDRLNNKLGTLTSTLLGAEHARERRNAKDLDRHNRRQDVLRRWKSRQFDRAIAKLEREKSAKIDELETVKTTFTEMMKLKAPVDYWRDKAKTHRLEAERYRSLLVDWGWKVGVGVLASLCTIAGMSFLFANADKPAASYLILVTIGVVITTMAFWAARIMVRLYMSEHHLAIDADERATMAMTYLALIERGAAEEKDRALILTPLFRPSSDGIVKDDAAPDLSPAALLSKALNR